MSRRFAGGTAAVSKACGPCLLYSVGTTLFIASRDDLPEAVGGVITVPDGWTWVFVASVDLEGERIEAEGVAAIVGQSSETTMLTSTGLASGAIIYSEHTLVLRDLLITPPSGTIGTHVDAAAGAYDWEGVNWVGAGQGVEIGDAANVVLEGCVWDCGEGGLNVSGELASLVIEGSLINAQAGTYGVQLDTGASITRRTRIEDSVVIVAATATGLDLPTARYGGLSEACILQDLNLSGAGTLVSGITYLNDEARWTGNRGITNTTRTGLISWASNATTTNIASSGTYYKAGGTAVASAFNQRFGATASPHRLTYTSALVQTFEVTATVSISAGNNNIVGVKVYKSGAQIDNIRGRSTTSANNRAEGVTVRTIVEMEEDDYLEVYVTNESSSGNITVTDLALLARVI